MSSLLKDAAAKGLTKEILLVKCPFLDENGDEKSGHLVGAKFQFNLRELNQLNTPFGIIRLMKPMT